MTTRNSPIMRSALLAFLMAGAAGTAQAQSSTMATDQPPAPPPPSMKMPAKPNADMQAVLDQQKALGLMPIEMLTADQARLQPSAADAATSLMIKEGMDPLPDQAVTTMDLAYGSDPSEFVRIYKPAAPMGPGPMPVIVYYHGGGWVIADVATYDATPRLMAKQLNAIVVSVEYRHAPEFKFPAQHDDAATAYRWVASNAASWGGDISRMALAGESAGGNLAVATAIYARDNNLPAPVAILAAYPIANSDMNLPSKKDAAGAKPLNTAMLKWFGYYYSTSMADMRDPRINLVKANLRGLPPTTIVNAQIDPLRSDGETLAAAMRDAGDRVEQRTFPGVTHEFFGMGKVVKGAYDAENYATMRLQAAFAK